jgi:hypothetical protein
MPLNEKAAHTSGPSFAVHLDLLRSELSDLLMKGLDLPSAVRQWEMKDQFLLITVSIAKFTLEYLYGMEYLQDSVKNCG